MTKYAFIVSAGAGDTIRDFYWDQQYASLEDMGPEDTCDIHITGINPFLHEFFSWHPRASQLIVKSYGYFVPDQEEELKRLHGIPLEGDYIPLPRSTKPVVFYPSPEDEAIFDGRLCDWEHPFDAAPSAGYIVYACGAGTPDRSIPSCIQKDIRAFTARIPRHFDIAVGRSFERGDGRWEPDMKVDLDLVDDLSLPGVCELVSGATGVVCSHSMVSMLAFLLHKPQLLLYPEHVKQRHFLSPDMWSFGMSNPEVVHGTFDDFEKNGEEMIDRFLQAMKVGGK